MKKLLVAATVACVVSLPSVARSQQVPCAPEDAVIKFLEERFGEFVHWRGEAGAGATMVLLLSRDGSWSMLTVREGVACIVAGGLNSSIDKGV